MTEQLTLAFDRSPDGASTRRVDKDGRLHIDVNNITKANVCGYLGSEIPNWQALGLTADREYQLLRAPEELKKAVSTANNIQLLRRHVAVSAEDPQKMDIVGSTGTDAKWVPPYIQNSLVIWEDAAIFGVETEQQHELSSSYRYDPDMTPGEYEGVKYDGVMRNIVFNHVALVEKGRAGPDVMVGDSAIILPPAKETIMPVKKKAALAALAADFKAKAAEIAPKLAADAALRPQHATYLKLAADAEKKADETDEEEMAGDEPMDLDAEDEEAETEEEKAMRMEKRAADKKARDKAAKDKKAKDAECDPPEPGKKPDAMDKKAMDAAIANAETNAVARMREIQGAERFVRPWVGDLDTLAMDSAEAVYGKALSLLKVDTTGAHPSGYRHILAAQPKPGTAAPAVAFDAAGAASFAERHPAAARIATL